MGRVLFRRSTSGIVLCRPSGEQQVVKTGQGVLTIVGEPAELVLVAFGRDTVQVQYEGDPALVKEFTTTSRGL